MEPWRKVSHCDCDLGRTTKPQQSGHFLPLVSPLGPPQPSNAKRRPRNVRMAEGSFGRGSAFTIAGWCFPFNGLVEISCEHRRAELETQVPDQEEQGNADGPPLGTPVVDVDVRDSKVGARPVGCPAELASDHHAFNSPCGVPQRAWDLKWRT